MNWEAISAIGEIIGAGAVVLSLVYVAVQIRQNTNTLRGAAAAEAVAAIREWNSRIVDDPAINAIFMKGVEGMTNLSPEEKARFVPLMFNLFKTFEHLHYQYARGALAPEIWAGWEVAAKGYLTSPGCMEYYRERRATLSREFQQWMDAPPPDAPFRRMGELATGSQTKVSE